MDHMDTLRCTRYMPRSHGPSIHPSRCRRPLPIHLYISQNRPDSLWSPHHRLLLLIEHKQPVKPFTAIRRRRTDLATHLSENPAARLEIRYGRMGCSEMYTSLERVEGYE